MTLKINTIKPKYGSRKTTKRWGRGGGSGKGNFSTHGCKGQKARSGGCKAPGFEGGQTPLYLRMPKLGGFRNPRRIEHKEVNVGDLNTNFKDGEVVNKESLFHKNLIKDLETPVKILGNGELSISLTIHAEKASKSAIEKIEKAKGKLVISHKANKESSPKSEASA
ncbi:MAG: 50S ribosomal protein L15 [Candidatus Gracilibacteria bacterium]